MTWSLESKEMIRETPLLKDKDKNKNAHWLIIYLRKKSSLCENEHMIFN